MNTIQKIVALASLCLLSTNALCAQSSATKKTETQAEQLRKKWFVIDEEEVKYRFTIELDKGESLVVKFKKLSDWSSPEDFLSAFRAADQVIALYKDSLQQEQNTQCLDVHIPANQKNLISRFSQSNESAGLMTIGSDGPSVLKAGTDTLRILQNKGNDAQIQYVFMLKKLDNYNTFSRDDFWKNKTAAKIDSIVQAYRSKWKNPDASRHQLTMTYTPATNKLAKYYGLGLSKSLLSIEGGIGVSLVRNTLCTNIEYGVGIYVSHEKGSSTFVRLSNNYFYRFAETAPNKLKGYATGFVNIEFGSESNHDLKSLFYKTSIGFGYKLINKHEEDRDPTMSRKMYRLFFNYSVNKFFVITPEIVTDFKKGNDKNQWFGVSLNLKIF